MSDSSRLILLGWVDGGATPIQADLSQGLGTAVAIALTLSKAYQMIMPRPPGYPFRPGFTGTAAATLDYPRTLAVGAQLLLLKPEADALIAAGAASDGSDNYVIDSGGGYITDSSGNRISWG